MYDKRLETFITVAEIGSISKAAEMLFTSASALSQQIARLEEVYELTLFERGPRGTRLTKAGLAFYKDAKEIVALSKAALSRAASENGRSRIQIRIGTEPLAPAYGLKPYLEALDSPSQYEVELFSFTDDFNESDYLLRRIGSSLDGIATILTPALVPYHLSFLPLHKVPVGLFLPFGHPLLSQRTVSVSQLEGMPLMLPAKGNPLIKDISDFLKEALSSPIVHRPDRYYSVDIFNQAVSEGDALIAPSVWDGIHPALSFRPVDWDFFSTYSFVYSENSAEETLLFVRDLRYVRNSLARRNRNLFKD